MSVCFLMNNEFTFTESMKRRKELAFFVVLWQNKVCSWLEKILVAVSYKTGMIENYFSKIKCRGRHPYCPSPKALEWQILIRNYDSYFLTTISVC